MPPEGLPQARSHGASYSSRGRCASMQMRAPPGELSGRQACPRRGGPHGRIHSKVRRSRCWLKKRKKNRGYPFLLKNAKAAAAAPAAAAAAAATDRKRRSPRQRQQQRRQRHGSSAATRAATQAEAQATKRICLRPGSILLVKEPANRSPFTPNSLWPNFNSHFRQH